MVEVEKLLTARQLQELLQVDRITIYRMLNDGRLRGFKVGGQWRFSRQAIERWLYEQQSSLDVPAPARAPEPAHPSVEALPVSCIRVIQEIVAEALGVAAVITAVDGTPVTPVANSCRFCDLVLSTAAGRQRCVDSWRTAAAEQGGTPRLATCHAGLCYMWGRIEIQGRFVAAIQAGQFLDEPSKREGWSAPIAKLAAATRLKPERLNAALAYVPVLGEARRQQVYCLIQRVATTFSELGEERLNLLGRLQRIAEITNLEPMANPMGGR